MPPRGLLILKVVVEAANRGDRDAALGMLDQALRTYRETEFQVSRPYDELQTTIHGEDALRPKEYLRHRLVRFEEYFGIKTHEHLQAPLDALSPLLELAAVYRIVVEALWNVAKHSGARNVYLESRRVGDLFLLRVRDDGRGFDPADPPPGMGLRYVRQRGRGRARRDLQPRTRDHGTAQVPYPPPSHQSAPRRRLTHTGSQAVESEPVGL